MNENKIDQKFDALVDQLVIRIPAFFRYNGIRFASNPFGWHLFLLIKSIGNSIGGMLVHFRSENDMDIFIEDTSEQLGGGFNALRRMVAGQFAWLAAINAAGAGLRFYTQLFLIALSACGCVFTGRWEMGAVAACIALSWVSTAFDLSYKPVTAGVRQVYISARIISALALFVPTLFYYMHYRDRGVSNNMFLQGLMIFMLMTHFMLFAIMVLPNRRQPLFLRVLSGILGILPCLLVSSIVAYSASNMGNGGHSLLIGGVRILGAVLLFLGERLETLYSLGSVRMPFSVFFLWLSNTFGLVFLMLAAWS